MFWFTLHKLKRRIVSLSARVLEGAAVVVIVLCGGLGSSWYMVEAGTRVTTERRGPWVIWTSAARPDADPYTRAHFVHAGTLPVSAAIERLYVAYRDDSGDRLHSSCEYAIEGKLTRADWWSIAVFDEAGRLIPNSAERYAFTDETVATDSAGAFTITLAREARPGNWLPVGGAGRLAVALKILDQGGADPRAKPADANLPAIRKVRCR